MPVTRADEGSEYAENGTGRRQPREAAVTPATVSGSAARPKGKRGPSRTSCAECRRCVILPCTGNQQLLTRTHIKVEVEMRRKGPL
jgi:hypothetical protein